MRTYRTNTGPFGERPFFHPTEIERMCVEELRRQGLYPSQPSPIRIDRFVEKRFRIQPAYEDLPAGLLGVTAFDSKGVQAILLSKQFDDAGTRTAERRLRTTLAHEAGHGLLHAHLFVFASDARRLFGDGATSDGTQILCRGEAQVLGARRSHSSPWWEYQANLVMGALLLPRPLVQAVLLPFYVAKGDGRVFPRKRTQEAVRQLSDTFDVNPVVAQIRLNSLLTASGISTRSKGWPFVRRIRPRQRPSGHE